MKKIIFICLSIVLVVGSVIALLVFANPKPVYATDIVINCNKIVLQVDEQINLSNSYVITPGNYTNRPVFSSSNENVATVGLFDGKLTAKNEGVSTIVITIKTSATKTKTARLDVEVIAKKLQVADQSAFILASEYKMPMYVFDFEEKNSVVRLCEGENIGTYVGEDCETEMY